MNNRQAGFAALSASILFLGGACDSEIADLDNPRAYSEAEGDCDPGGGWTMTTTAADGECFSAGSFDETLTVTRPKGEVTVDYQDSTEFERLQYFDNICRLLLVRRTVVEETETSFESNTFRDLRFDIEGDTFSGELILSQSLLSNGAFQSGCMQTFEVTGAR